MLFAKRLLAMAIIVAGVNALTASEANAQIPQIGYGGYYAGPNYNASLYPSPVPVPPIAGHTMITYGPLQPHNFMYLHHRNFYCSHPDGSRTHTKIKYGYMPTMLDWSTKYPQARQYHYPNASSCW